MRIISIYSALSIRSFPHQLVVAEVVGVADLEQLVHALLRHGSLLLWSLLRLNGSDSDVDGSELWPVETTTRLPRPPTARVYSALPPLPPVP